MTSAVSQHMIYGIPFREGMPPLCYDPEELKDYFPKARDGLAGKDCRSG